MVGVLVCGLRDNSRIKLKESNSPVDSNTMMLASILDHLRILLWRDTRDAKHGLNKPKSILQTILDANKPKEYSTFSSGEEFEKARQRILEKIMENENG